MEESIKIGNVDLEYWPATLNRLDREEITKKIHLRRRRNGERKGRVKRQPVQNIYS
jgi:hypothetical protein